MAKNPEELYEQKEFERRHFSRPTLNQLKVAELEREIADLKEQLALVRNTNDHINNELDRIILQRDKINGACQQVLTDKEFGDGLFKDRVLDIMGVAEMTEEERLADLSEYLQKRRRFFGVPRKVMGEVIGINPATYASYELGKVSNWTDTADKILNSRIYDDRVMRQARDKYVKEWTKAVAKRGNKAKAKEHQRIPNIPNFYERLDALCDEGGRVAVDENHPDLQELRVAVGGKRVIPDVAEFRDELIRIRKEKGLSQKEAAEIAGVDVYALRNYEYRGVKTKTPIYQKIIDSPLFEGSKLR